MYILTDGDTPFAIVENNTNMRIERAVAEEYLFEEVSLIGEVILPDWGETKLLDYVALEEDGFEHVNQIEITKLVKY